MIQVFGISAFDKTPIKEFLTEYQVDQTVNEQYNILTLEF